MTQAWGQMRRRMIETALACQKHQGVWLKKNPFRVHGDVSLKMGPWGSESAPGLELRGNQGFADPLAPYTLGRPNTWGSPVARDWG